MSAAAVSPYLTVADVARLLHRKPWPIIEAIEAGELRASMPSNRGAWLIRPADLSAYVDRFTNDVTSGALLPREQRDARARAEVDQELADRA